MPSADRWNMPPTCMGRRRFTASLPIRRLRRNVGFSGLARPILTIRRLIRLSTSGWIATPQPRAELRLLRLTTPGQKDSIRSIFDHEDMKTKPSPPSSPDCLFCKISSGTIPANRVYEDELSIGFPDINPQAPAHFLIIPKQHIGSTAKALAEDTALMGHLMATAAEIARKAMLWCRPARQECLSCPDPPRNQQYLTLSPAEASLRVSTRVQVRLEVSDRHGGKIDSWGLGATEQ